MITARWILPISGPPINGGWIRVRDGLILEVGHRSPDEPSTDLGDVALLPGMVNAHCHLEFSDCRTPIGHRGIRLNDWITEVIRSRSRSSEEARRQSIEHGLRESGQSGVDLMGEITTPPCVYTEGDDIPCLVTFAEVLGLSAERANERLNAAIEHNATSASAAWSPHAPYSTSRDIVDQCIEHSARTRRPLAMHVAESPEERELLRSGSGPFAETLRQLGVWREGIFPWGEDPFGVLIEHLSRAHLPLLVHGNDLQPAEIEALSQHAHMSVVFCPRTHAFFQHERHPVDRLRSAGVRVALGTDSRASNPDLNLWREVQYLLHHRGDLDPADVIAMATIAGADALGHKNKGRIAVDCRTRLGYVNTSADNLDRLHDDLAQGDYVPLAV